MKHYYYLVDTEKHETIEAAFKELCESSQRPVEGIEQGISKRVDSDTLIIEYFFGTIKRINK